MTRSRLINGLPAVPGVPGFKLNLTRRKEIFLPRFTITLLHTPKLGPNYARFQVPLNFSKLDLRDYLARAYGVGVTSITSYVKQQKPTRARSGTAPGIARWRRPRSLKRMTVELVEPFEWPEQPKDTTEWETERYRAVIEEQKEISDSRQVDAAMKEPEDERAAFAEQAKKLLKGEMKWQPTWQAMGLGVKGVNEIVNEKKP